MQHDTAARAKVRDMQRCFEQERATLLRDTENMKKQMEKNRKRSEQASNIASQQIIQLKKENASLHKILTNERSSRENFERQFKHVSSLLESSMDQHQIDQDTVNDLNTRFRIVKKEHEQAIKLMEKEAVRVTRLHHEEIKRLTARIDHYRCCLEQERTEWCQFQASVQRDRENDNSRVKMMSTKLVHSQFREKSYHILMEKAAKECVGSQKLTSGSSQQALTAFKYQKYLDDQKYTKIRNSELQEMNETVLMASEDHDMLSLSRIMALSREYHLQCDMVALQEQAKTVIIDREEQIQSLRIELNQCQFLCKNCGVHPDQIEAERTAKEEDLRREMETRIHKECQDEHRIRFEGLTRQYLDLYRTLQCSDKQLADLVNENKISTKMLAEQLDKIKELMEELSLARKHIHYLEEQEQTFKRNLQERDCLLERAALRLNEAESMIEHKHQTLQELQPEVDGKILRAEAQQQIKSQELDAALAQVRKLERSLYEASKHKQKELLKNDKKLADLIAAQQQAKSLIQVQARTIEDLLQLRSCACNHTKRSDIASDTSESASSTSIKTVEHYGTISNYNVEMELLQNQIHTLEHKVQEQALTIHQLSLQDDEQVLYDSETTA